MTIISTFLEFNLSPLDQFDDVNWVLFNSLWEGVEAYNIYTFELEYNIFSIWENKGTFTQFFDLNSFFDVKPNSKYHPLLGWVILGMIYYQIKDDNIDLWTEIKTSFTKAIAFIKGFIAETNFSMLFLLGFFHLFTGFVLFAWFDDFIISSWSVNKESLHFFNNWILDSNIVNFPYGEKIDLFILPQINFGIIFDENFISFLAAFFLLGGAEEEEDEDFLLEEEESDFIEDIVAPLFITNLGKDVEDNGALFLKVCSVFGFVLFNNLMGMLPYSNTATSGIILTFWVSLSVFGSLMFLMIRKHGINYFFNLFIPSGAPLALIFLLIPIEFISYTFRLVSLSVRLFANMFAGHTLLKIIVGYSWSMLLIGDIFLLVNLFPIAIIFILTFLEIGVAIVQAYIFTTLTCIYLKDIFVAH